MLNCRNKVTLVIFSQKWPPKEINGKLEKNWNIEKKDLYNLHISHDAEKKCTASLSLIWNTELTET